MNPLEAIIRAQRQNGQGQPLRAPADVARDILAGLASLPNPVPPGGLRVGPLGTANPGGPALLPPGTIPPFTADAGMIPTGAMGTGMQGSAGAQAVRDAAGAIGPAVLALLTGAARAQNDPQLPGPLNAIPRPIRAGLGVVAPLVPGIGALATPGGQVGQALAGKVMENPVGNAVSGEGLYAIARIVQAARAASGPGTPSTPMSVLADQVVAQGAGHPIRIQQMVEHSPNPIVSKAAGAQAMVFDPANVVGGAGEAMQGTKLGRVGELLNAVDVAQNAPVEALGALAKAGSAAAKQRLLRTFVAESEKVGGKEGGVAQRLMPKVGGAKQYGAPPPPEFTIPRPGMVEGLQPAPPPGQIGLFDPQPSQLPLPQAGATPAPQAKQIEQLIEAVKPATGAAPPGEIGAQLPSVAAPHPEALNLETPPLTARRDALDTFGQMGVGDKARMLGDLLEANYGAGGGKVASLRNIYGRGYINPDEMDAAFDHLIQRASEDPKALAALAEINPPLAHGIPTIEPAAQSATELQNAIRQKLGQPPKKGTAFADAAGGMGLLPFRGGLGAANRAVGGALAGGAAGGAAGALASPDDRLGGAARGAAIGALAGGNLGAGAPALAHAAGYGPEVFAHSHEAGKIEQGAANAASGGLGSAIRNFWTVTKQGITEHPRNILGDEGWGRTVLLGAQGKEGHALLRQVRDDAAQRLNATTPWDREPQQVQDVMRAFGKEGQVPDLGDSFHAAEGKLARKVISTSDRVIGQAVGSFLNPAAIAPNLVGAAGATVLAGARPWWHGFFQAFNGFQQATFRRAAFADEAATGLRLAAERFLPDIQAAGHNIAGLAPDGSFSPKDVYAVAGQQAADRWQAYGAAIEDAASKRVKFLFGDYSKRGGVEQALGGPIPFASWMIRAYPVALSLLAQHPAVALAAYQYMRLTSRGAGQDGRPGYTAGMIPADDRTPLLGALVRLYTQGAGGKGYLDPVGGISPVGGELFQPAEDDSQKNWYQRGTALLSRLGLPGVNPAIQAGAYVAGLDYKAPGALSRTQGLENAAALLPGNPALPDVAGGLLRAARGGVSQATAAAGLPGAQADKTPVAYDPITRRYAELWYAKTGKTLNDPSDPSGLLAMGDPDNPMMQQARREVLTAGAVKNIGSLTSPVGVIGQSGENAQYRAARVGEPFSAARIAGSSPGVQQLMQAGNAQYRQATPASQMYTVGNREQGAYALLDQFEADPQVLWMQQYAPKSYQMRRDELMIRLGLKEPPKPARQNPYLPAGR